MVLCQQYFVSLVQVKICISETLYLADLLFSEQTNFFEPKLVLFPKYCIIIGSVESKTNFSDNPCQNILALLNNLLRSDSLQVNRYLISSITNLVYEFPNELPNHLRLRILGNQEILEKCQIRVETQPSAQSPFQKLNVDNSCKRTRKIKYYIVKVLSNSTEFLWFMPNIFARIV